jgi:hypothetical protein
MPAECVLTFDNLSVIRPALCTERITVLDARRMLEACRALSIARPVYRHRLLILEHRPHLNRQGRRDPAAGTTSA